MAAEGSKVEEGESMKRAPWTGKWATIDPTDPAGAAKQLAEWQTVKRYSPADPSEPKAEGTVRLVCISDTHSLESRSQMADIPDGDVLVHAGDFSNTGTKKEVKHFAEWVTALPHKHKVVIAGNHDTVMDTKYYETKGARRFHHGKITGTAEECRGFFGGSVVYLEDAGATVAGLKFWGSPWQPEFCDWAFNLDRGDPLQEKWDKIPEDVDVLVTHGPPILHGDRCADGFQAGCVNLLHDIQTRIKPSVHVFGHIHEGYGATTDGATVYVNASTCTFHYRPTQPPIVIDVPLPSSDSA